MADGLTATAQAGGARVLLRLEWAGVTLASIVRVHADGTTVPVRNAEPGMVNTTWVDYDHEVPLDRPVSYRATSTQSGTVHTSATVTVGSLGKPWLTHPGKPWLSRSTVVRELSDRTGLARRGVLRPLDRPEAVVIHAPRTADAGVLLVNTAAGAELERLKAMLVDGAALLLRTPSTWEAAGEALYLSLGDAARQNLTRVGADPRRRLVLPFDVTGRPPGRCGGAAGLTYDDLQATGKTYNTITGTIDDLVSGF